MVGVDALEAKVWGERDDHSGVTSEHCRGQHVADDDEERNDSGEGSNLDYDSDTDSDESGDSLSGDSDDEDSVSETESGESSQAPSPPPSRTPSPSSSPPSLPQLTSQSYAQELEALRTAERLLSRTLASACGENDGQGMASEMGKYRNSQNHLLYILTSFRIDSPDTDPHSPACSAKIHAPGLGSQTNPQRCF